jgi:hypothetical protein
VPLRIGIIGTWPDMSGSSGGSANPVVIDTTSLPDATQGVAYSVQLLAHGGTPPYTWSIFAGSLPAGLTLSSSGLISGTPTGAPGTDDFTVQAVDPIGNTAIWGLGAI